MADLSGRVALVTGSTKGIGRAVAEALAAAGADVAVSSRTPADVERAASELDAVSPGRVVGIPADVSRVEDCRSLVADTVELLGGLDILVNNAGIGVFKPIQEISIEEWQRQIDTNLGGVFYCSKFALPHLLASDDAWIVNIGSLACRNTFPGGVGYNASKFGLLGMTEAMMLDVRDQGVRVSIVMPGSVETWFNDHEPGPEGAWKLQPEDIARAVLHVVSYPDNALASRIEMRPSRPPRR
ncbi:MAG: SDR family oxidoreductase [Gemmatimonadetes bacterium]|nr:MAG: SDR family oxidoreductase [Gemmatimonadota bacterium]